MNQLEARCGLYLTDDYLHDNANNQGIEKEWYPLSSLHLLEWTLKNSSFSGEKDGIIKMRVHSNLYYSLRLKK